MGYNKISLNRSYFAHLALSSGYRSGCALATRARRRHGPFDTGCGPKARAAHLGLDTWTAKVGRRMMSRMKTRAAVLRDVGKDWEIIELDLDPPKDGEVLVRFAAAGLCHSDDHLRTGDIPVRYPIVGGHEGRGLSRRSAAV